jgi:AcrR family transcriptional regulator
MANKKSNQQFKKTEEKMMKTTLELMERFPFEKITVRKICETAEVNRSTFYAHFIDIYDLLGKIELTLRFELEDSYKSNNIMQTGVVPFTQESFLIFIQYIHAHQAFYRILLKNDRQFPLQQYEHYWDRVFDPLQQQQTVISKEEIMYYLMGFQGCFTMIMRKWLENDCRESEEDMAKIVTGCVPEIWRQLTERYFCE